METKVGDWVVEKGGYGYELHKVSSVTAVLAHYIKYGNREGRIRKQDIVFSGTEAAATRLNDQLRSSRAQRDQEVSACHERQNKRDAGFITRALSAPQPV